MTKPKPQMSQTAESKIVSANLHRQINYRLHVLSNLISREASRTYGRTFGVTLAEIRAVRLLAFSPGSTIAELAQVLALDKAQVSRAVASLEENKMLQKSSDPMDRRLVRLSLTEKGMQLHRDSLPYRNLRQKRLANSLAPGELDTLLRLLGKLQDYIEENGSMPSEAEVSKSDQSTAQD